MSQPSKNYIDNVVRWAYANGEIELKRINMTPEQRFRARLCLDVYHKWMENKSVPIRQMIRRLAARDYALLLDNAAMGMEEAQDIVNALRISRDPATGAITARSETEISNDVYVANTLVGRLNVAKQHLHKAMYEDNIEWLMGFGRKTGNVSAIKEAQRNLEKINNDFKGDEDPQSSMPQTQINITGDVSIIKKGRTSMTDEERDRLRKKYGLTEKEMSVQLEEINGIWQQPEEEERDVFVENEED